MKVAIFGLDLKKKSVKFFCDLHHATKSKKIEIIFWEKFFKAFKEIPEFKNANYRTFSSNNYEVILFYLILLIKFT